jgi:hypothetical protein
MLDLRRHHGCGRCAAKGKGPVSGKRGLPATDEPGALPAGTIEAGRKSADQGDQRMKAI